MVKFGKKKWCKITLGNTYAFASEIWFPRPNINPQIYRNTLRSWNPTQMWNWGLHLFSEVWTMLFCWNFHDFATITPPPPGLEKSSANKIILPRRRCYLARGKRAHHLLCDWCTFSSTRDAFRKKLVPVIDEVCMHEWRGGVNLNKSLIVATRHPRCVCKPPSLHVQMGVLKCVEIGFWICFFLLPFVSKNAKHGHFWQVWGEVKNPLTKAANLWGGGSTRIPLANFFKIDLSKIGHPEALKSSGSWSRDLPVSQVLQLVILVETYGME